MRKCFRCGGAVDNRTNRKGHVDHEYRGRKMWVHDDCEAEAKRRPQPAYLKRLERVCGAFLRRHGAL
jgi:hypothetical protein